MSRLARGLILSVAAGALLYLGFAVWSGWREVGHRLAEFAWPAAAIGVCLALLNYGLRFLKWQYYLSRIEVAVPPGRSLATFVAGFALTVTPGKIGEVLKSYLLRQSDGIPMARTAPIVVAERVTDLIACLALTVLGVGAFAAARQLAWIWITGGALLLALITVVAVKPAGDLAIHLIGRLPVVGRIAPKLHEFYASTRVLLAPAPTVVATAISIGAWFCECLAFWIILRGFPGTEVDLVRCTFIYAGMTIAGALSFLPGGLGVQEAGMVALLIAAGRGVDEPTAFAATFVTRACTLWLAVLLGVGTLSVLQRRTSVDLAEMAQLESTPRA